MDKLSKERRREIKRELKESEREMLKEGERKRTARVEIIAENMELLEVPTIPDIDTRDALYIMLGSLLEKGEIVVVSGSLDFNYVDVSAEFIHCRSGQKWKFLCWDAKSKGGGYLKKN